MATIVNQREPKDIEYRSHITKLLILVLLASVLGVYLIVTTVVITHPQSGWLDG